MFGLFKKPCEHKRRHPVNISIIEGIRIENSPNIEGEIIKEIYYCEDCRVLFLPRDKETIGRFHEKIRTDNGSFC